MKTRHILIAAALALTTAATAETYHVYLLAGQSNMDGYGLVEDLTPEQRAVVPGARIFLGQVRNDFEPAEGVGFWSDLTPGLGAGSRTDGESITPAARFGPELSFARRLRELRPDERVAIIKYAKGGSSIDDRVADWGTWDPHDTRGEGASPPEQNAGVNQYDHALATIRRAMRVVDNGGDIDGDGTPDELIPAGIVWMQGETDATNPQTAGDYDDNMTELIGLLRAAMWSGDLPFVMGRISDSKLNAGEAEPVWTHGDIVRAAQAEVSLLDPNVELVTSTDAYGYSDFAHYDAAGYLDLGEKFAEAMDGLRKSD